ncbi:MAG: PadR family transcriptional regulator [Candidatus Aenigmarchaeota archaeon]|nr:PadR family transcriptional regulator [Candidatus Aenigmarchaeota archaeon]
MTDKLLRRLADLNTKDCLWIYILRILQDRETHAYMLRKQIEDRFGFKPGTVTAYRVLYHLTGKGFVSKKAEGRRKIYYITEKGKEALKDAITFYKGQIKSLES